MSTRAQRRDARRRRNESRMEFQWRQTEKQISQHQLRVERDSDDAEKVLGDLEVTLRRTEMKGREDAKRADATITAKYAAEEKRLLSQPRTQYTGATHGVRAVPVRHWDLALPDSVATRIGVSASGGFGPLALLTADGQMLPSVSVMVSADPGLRALPEFMDWARRWRTVWRAEVQPKYMGLPRLRNDEWWRELSERLGLTISTERPQERVTGVFGTYERKRTVVSVPSLARVDITRTGLRTAYRHRVGDSAKAWAAKTDGLRAGFLAVGLPAAEAVVSQDSAANLVIHFNDKDPFGTQPESGTFDDTRMRSLLGVTAHGDDGWINWAGSSGLVVGGVPGSGKTASLLPLFAGMAGKADLYVFDGKAGFDLHVLRHIAKTYDNSGDISAPLETLRRLEAGRTQRARFMYEKIGANNFWNLDPRQRRQFGLQPQFVVLDEVQTWTDTSGMDAEEKKTSAEITKLIRTLVQKGRSAGIVVILTTQKPDATTIPTVIRDNAALKIAFRVSTPEQAVTILGKQNPESPTPTDIRQATVGRCVMETEGRGIVLVQAGYTSPSELEERLGGHAPVRDVPEPGLVAECRERDPVDPEAAARAARVARMTDAERAEAIRQEAIRQGHLPPDDLDNPPAEAEDIPVEDAGQAVEPTKPAGAPRTRKNGKTVTYTLDDGTEITV